MPAQIGLTGSIGAGKSTVARLLAERGAVVIDADALARAVMDDPEVVAEIGAALGRDVVADGALDRTVLAARVFEDAAARARLEAIVHPRVAAARRSEVARALERERPPLIVHDVPLLFETGIDREMDAVLVVDAPLPTRIARVARRSGLDPDEVRRRDAAQMPAEEKRRRADVVVRNDGDLDGLRRRLDRIWPDLLRCGED